MKTVWVEGSCETAYGQKISEVKKSDGTFHEPFKYKFSYEAYENKQEVMEKGAGLSDKEYVATVNNAEKAAARSAAVTKELDDRGIKKPTLENNPDLQLKTLVSVLVAAGRSEAEAEQIARATLGLDAQAA